MGRTEFGQLTCVLMLQACYAAHLAVLPLYVLLVPRPQAVVSWDHSGPRRAGPSALMLRELHVCLGSHAVQY